MTYLKRHYERPDLWTNLKVNNLIPLISFLVGVMSVVYIYQAKIDRTLDRVGYLETQFNDYRTVEYKNAIDVSALKSRLGIPDDSFIKGASTSSSLQINPRGR